MKKIFGFFMLSVLFVGLAVVNAVAQVVDTTGIGNFSPSDDLSGLAGWLNWYNILYGGLVIGWGYLAKVFGIKTKPGNYVFIVAAGGLVLAGGFLALGFSKAFPLVFSFLSAIGVYDLIFRPAKKLFSPVA